MIRVEEISGKNAVAGLEQVWKTIQEQSPNTTPFQTWEWNSAWWRYFHRRKRAHILLFHAPNGQPIAIAPLYTSRHLGTPLRRLAWMGAGTSDYLGLLSVPDWEIKAGEALFIHIQTRMRCWDIADLQQLSAGSCLPKLCPPNSPVSLLPMEACPFLPLPDSWEKLIAGLSKKMRYNIGYYRRVIEKTFPDSAIFSAGEYELKEGMDALFSLHHRRWKARWLPGVFSTDAIQSFHREIASLFLKQGRLRLHLLRADGAYRAVLYAFTSPNKTYYYQAGFDPEFSKYSPGTTLLAHAIKEAIQEGHTEFDFLRGEESYKYRWLPQKRVNQRLLILRSHSNSPEKGTLSGRAGLALNTVERYVEEHAKAFLSNRNGKYNSDTVS